TGAAGPTARCCPSPSAKSPRTPSTRAVRTPRCSCRLPPVDPTHLRTLPRDRGRPVTAAAAPDIVRLDTRRLSDLLPARQLSCVEVMTAYLDHIERLNPQVNAIVSLVPRDALLAQAAERDAALGRGEPAGWLHGVPLAVKDLLPTRGIRT